MIWILLLCLSKLTNYFWCYKKGNKILWKKCFNSNAKKQLQSYLKQLLEFICFTLSATESLQRIEWTEAEAVIGRDMICTYNFRLTSTHNLLFPVIQVYLSSHFLSYEEKPLFRPLRALHNWWAQSGSLCPTMQSPIQDNNKTDSNGGNQGPDSGSVSGKSRGIDPPALIACLQNHRCIRM